jgi:hypothetical protein
VIRDDSIMNTGAVTSALSAWLHPVLEVSSIRSLFGRDSR